LHVKPHFGQKLQIQKSQGLSCKEKLRSATISKNSPLLIVYIK